MNNDKQKKVIPLLREIASRLWDGRAAVLVGAGFSRNAQPTSSSSRKFPMWNDLGDLFYGKIYCDKNSNKYSNVLKLADEVDAAFGRSALEKIILDNVPDKEYEPSELHKQLLNLPWSDVFTTNYDTLLERACVFVDSKKYDIVINKNDLINAEKPRIVKLHGSFPSERPFIITEEDYRCYPKNFSPFVNTVQQSLIENTLCLIGFSGDDPNFLNWIGWIRDNLDEKNSPKIFLISLSDFNEAQRKLLERRNIIIIDLSLLGDFNGDHARAHLAFIEFINTNKKKEVDINWPQNNSSSAQNIYHNESIDEKKNKTLKAKDIWLKDRENYPGWCIAPEDNRKSLWAKTREWLNIFDEIDSWDFGEDLEIAFELNWRIKTCLLPIFDNTASGMKTIIEKYANSFLNKDPYPRNISLQLPPLIISMLRYYRQENDNNNWNNLHTLALKCKNLFNLHDEASLNYESVLFSFHNLRIEEALDKLSKWEKNELLPFIEAKRAGLLAELGHVDDAISILENSLNTLRKNNFSTSKHADFSISSQEAYIMLLLYFIKRNNGRTLKSSNEAYHLRWAKLSQFKCDPMVELKIFEIRLEGYSNESKEVSEKNNFDIGKRTTSLGFGFSNINKIVLDSFSFLIFCEEMGLPPRIPKTSIVKNTFGKAAAVIYEHCPGWALFTLLRIGDEKIIGSFFGRSLISKIGRDDVQESIDSHFLALKACHLKIKSLNEEESKHLYISFIKCLTELISRLITKSSYSKKTEIIEFICILFNDPNFDEIAYFSNLLERTINSLSSEQKIETLPVFLKFPARPLNNRIRPHNFTNPFLFITDLIRTDTQTLKIKISNQEITNFINEIKNANDESRIIPSVTMIVLYQLGYLSQSNVKRLIKSLWIKVDEFGFPSNAGYRRFYFIKNLHPNDINTRDLMMEYIKTKDFPIATKGENGIPLGNGQNEYCAELLGSINYIEYPQEIITSILLSLESWFNHDKELLNKKNVDVKNQIDKNFEVLIRIVTKLFIKFEGNFSKEADEIINRLVLNMQDYGLRVTPILVLLNRGGLSKINELDKLCDSLYSNESKVILRTLRSISDLLGAEIDCSELLLCLADKIKWNAEPEIKHCLEIAERAITEITFIEKDKFINVVITGLKRILEDQVNDKLDGSIYLDSLETKINAAKVALSIYKKSISEKKTINKVILDWKHLCESSEEFDEVKNSWIS